MFRQNSDSIRFMSRSDLQVAAFLWCWCGFRVRSEAWYMVVCIKEPAQLRYTWVMLWLDVTWFWDSWGAWPCPGFSYNELKRHLNFCFTLMLFKCLLESLNATSSIVLAIYFLRVSSRFELLLCMKGRFKREMRQAIGSPLLLGCTTVLHHC